MCFTPTVSFSIFAIEWVLAFFVLSKRPNGKFREAFNLAALLLFFLGAYQFTQGMFCEGDKNLWGRAGFVAYTFLPALGLHYACSLLWKKFKYYLYAIPAIFSLFAIFLKDFMGKAECTTVFIIAQHSWNQLLSAAHAFYYFFFIFLSALMLLDGIRKQRSQDHRRILWIGFWGIIAFTFPAFVLIIMFPSMGIVFPSMLCEFALLYAISVFLMMYVAEKGYRRPSWRSK